MRIVIIGAGVSGLVAARVLMRFGYEVVVLERSNAIGGVWARTYPDVRLQNMAKHYRFSDFPWPFTPDLHPTADQVRRYLQAAVDHFRIDVRLQHQVVALHEQPDGWQVEQSTPDGTRTEHFDFAIIAAGHFTQDRPELPLPGRERFTGTVLHEGDIDSFEKLSGKRVAVVGFGKTALDLATFAAEHGAQVHHVFREPRWVLPKYVFGVHLEELIMARISSVMVPAWVHPNRVEQALHEHLKPVVSGFWEMITGIIRLQLGMYDFGRDPETRERLKQLLPDDPLTYHMRAATALAPDNYFPSVVKGKILPYRSEIAGFSENELLLSDGRSIACDVAVFAVGHKSPQFPFLPERYRKLFEDQSDGAQLYRHLLHPRVPRLAFAGFNQSFLHFICVEVGMVWLGATLRGDITLPSPEEMERSIERVRQWKQENILFAPSRSYDVSTRFHQYLDVMLADLGVSPYRKKNPLTELLGAYQSDDYRGVFEEWERGRARRPAPGRPVALDT
jgi:dimethylaniline monooxygenase (N-oxide forming)